MELAELNWATGCKWEAETGLTTAGRRKKQPNMASLDNCEGERCLENLSIREKGRKEEPQDVVGRESWMVFQV